MKKNGVYFTLVTLQVKLRRFKQITKDQNKHHYLFQTTKKKNSTEEGQEEEEDQEEEEGEII